MEEGGGEVEGGVAPRAKRRELAGAGDSAGRRSGGVFCATRGVSVGALLLELFQSMFIRQLV